MKILYLHQYFQTPKGISGIRSYTMAIALINSGHTVTIICGSLTKNGNTGLNKPFVNGKRRGIVDNIDVIEYDLRYKNHLNYFERTKIFLKFTLYSIGTVFREDFDIIFATSTPLTIGIPGIFARWFKKKKFIFEVRDLWPELPQAMGIIKNPFILSLIKYLEWGVYYSANRLIALSPGILKGITKITYNSKKVDMIPNGSDLNLFSRNFFSTRHKYVSQNDLMVIFTGAHGVANGLDAVLDAASVVKKRGYKKVKFVLIGDGALKIKLKIRAKQEKIDNIIFLDPMPKLELIGLMKDADLGLQILDNIPEFYYGTSPNKFFDYIAAGLPVLNNYPGWLADLIVKYECGFAIKPSDPEIFADKIIFALENPHKLKKMSFNALKLAKTEFDIEILKEKFVDCFEEFKSL